MNVGENDDGKSFVDLEKGNVVGAQTRQRQGLGVGIEDGESEGREFSTEAK